MEPAPNQKIVLLGTTSRAAIHFRGPFIRALAERGHTVYVFCQNYTATTRDTIKQLGGLPMDSPFKRIDFNPLSSLIASLKFYKQLKHIAPDTILSYFVTPAILGTLVARSAKIRNRVVMLEGLGYVFTDRPDKKSIKSILLKFILLSLYRFILPLANRIILLNPDDLHELKNKYHLKLPPVTILHGIGVPDCFFQNDTLPPIEPITFTFIGRLLYDKGIREFIEAARQIAAENKDVHFKVVGDADPVNPSSLSAATIQTLKELHLIEFTGYTDNIISAIKNSSVIVLPSYREGFPRIIQEAMALGRPVITTDVPGCRETISNGIEGFLAPPFSAAAIAEHMQFFINHPDKIMAMGKSAAITAQKNYTEQKATANLMNALFIDSETIHG